MPGTGDKEADALLARAYALASKEDAIALYRDWADGYDRSMLDGLGYESPRRCVDALGAHLDARDVAVLDVGCGTGLAGPELVRIGLRVIDGLDFSPEMLAVARRRGIYRTLHEADLTRRLRLDDASYGAMVCTGTFTHAHVGAACLDELFRVLAPGGLFAFTVHLDVWEPMGFAPRIDALLEAGTIEWVEHFEERYFASSPAPDGHFCVFRRR